MFVLFLDHDRLTLFLMFLILFDIFFEFDEFGCLVGVLRLLREEKLLVGDVALRCGKSPGLILNITSELLLPTLVVTQLSVLLALLFLGLVFFFANFIVW